MTLNALTALTRTPPLPAFHNLTQLYARRAHQISTAVFEDERRSVGLTPAQFGALSVLRASPGLGQSSLARALGFDKVSMLRVLRGLGTRRLIARLRTPDPPTCRFHSRQPAWRCCSC